MAKEDLEDEQRPFMPPDAKALKGVISIIDELSEQKNGIASQQKAKLDEFNRAHSMPPFIVKILRKIDGMDEPERTNAARALRHGMGELKLGNQGDMFEPKAEPEVQKAKTRKGAKTPPKPKSAVEQALETEAT